MVDLLLALLLLLEGASVFAFCGGCSGECARHRVEGLARCWVRLAFPGQRLVGCNDPHRSKRPRRDGESIVNLPVTDERHSCAQTRALTDAP